MVDLFVIYQLSKLEEDQEENNFKNKIARDAYSSIYELNGRKRNYIVKSSYKKDNQERFYIPEKAIPYNVHEYIGEICNSFKNVIAQITAINKESVSVSFIYVATYVDVRKRTERILNKQYSNWDFSSISSRRKIETPIFYDKLKQELR